MSEPQDCDLMLLNLFQPESTHDCDLMVPSTWLTKYIHALRPHKRYEVVGHILGDARCDAELGLVHSTFPTSDQPRPDDPVRYWEDKIANMIKLDRVDLGQDDAETKEKISKVLKDIERSILHKVTFSGRLKLQKIYEDYFALLLDPSQVRRGREKKQICTKKELHDQCRVALQDLKVSLQADMNSENWIFDPDVVYVIRRIDYRGDDEDELRGNIIYALVVANAAQCVVSGLVKAVEKMREVGGVDGRES